MTDLKIYLLGASGHALSVMDALDSNGQYPAGYFEVQASEKIDLPYLGKESAELLQQISAAENAVFFACIGNNRIRESLTELIRANVKNSFQIIHSKASVSRTASVAPYAFLGAGVIVNSRAEIGLGAIVNTGAIVEHECVVGNFAHIGPGAVLCGDVSIGERAFVGANATIRQGIKIGKEAIVGAGSVVVKDVEDHGVYVGTPAKFLKKNGE